MAQHNANLLVSGTVSLLNGSAGAPSYSFTGETDTGMYQKATDILGFSAQGVERLTVSGISPETHGVGIEGNLTVTGTVAGEVVAGTQGYFGYDNNITNFDAPQISFGGSENTGFGYNHGANYPFMACNGTLVEFWSVSYAAIYKQLRLYTNTPQGAGVPAYAFQQDTDTGIFQIQNGGDNNLRFATDGTEAGRFDEVQSLHVTKEVVASGLQLTNLPTSSGSLQSGQVWVDTTADHTLKVTP